MQIIRGISTPNTKKPRRALVTCPLRREKGGDSELLGQRQSVLWPHLRFLTSGNCLNPVNENDVTVKCYPSRMLRNGSRGS
jgi:hypothetical protein